MLSFILRPEVAIWILIIFIWIISKLAIRLNYISVYDIIKNHFNCFRGAASGKLKLFPVLSYCAVPLLMGLSAAFVKQIDTGMINIITVIVTIMATMLFSLLTTVIDMKAKIKENPDYYHTDAQISKEALIETYYAVMFEILICVILLILCFVHMFTECFPFLQSFLIYGLAFLLVVNLLLVLKRVFRVIDTDMKK